MKVIREEMVYAALNIHQPQLQQTFNTTVVPNYNSIENASSSGAVFELVVGDRQHQGSKKNTWRRLAMSLIAVALMLTFIVLCLPAFSFTSTSSVPSLEDGTAEHSLETYGKPRAVSSRET